MMKAALFVGDLSSSCNEQELEKTFSIIGPVKHVRIQRSVDNQSLGYGFVKMSSPTAAAQAITAFDGYLLCGRKLKVRFAAYGMSKETGDKRISIYVKFAAVHAQASTDEETINSVFSSCGGLSDVNIRKKMVDKRKGVMRGFGFLQFLDNEEGARGASIAVKTMSDVTVKGIHYTLEVSKELEKKLSVSPPQSASTPPQSAPPQVQILHAANAPVAVTSIMSAVTSPKLIINQAVLSGVGSAKQSPHHPSVRNSIHSAHSADWNCTSGDTHDTTWDSNWETTSTITMSEEDFGDADWLDKIPTSDEFATNYPGFTMSSWEPNCELKENYSIPHSSPVDTPDPRISNRFNQESALAAQLGIGLNVSENLIDRQRKQMEYQHSIGHGYTRGSQFNKQYNFSRENNDRTSYPVYETRVSLQASQFARSGCATGVQGTVFLNRDISNAMPHHPAKAYRPCVYSSIGSNGGSAMRESFRYY